jgi:hypothetical protein
MFFPLAQVIDFLRTLFTVTGVGVGTGAGVAAEVTTGVGVGESKGATGGIDPEASCCNFIFNNGDE